MRLLFLSWRDPRNPKAGGAELYTHEVARRLVARGDTVEWFVAGFPGGAPEEDLDGVHIVRSGKQWTVHMHAYRHYHRERQMNFDAVLDEVNTIPFFTPLWARIPSLMLIYQLAREVWWHESAFPLNAVGWSVEPAYLRLYRRTPALTISASTETDLRNMGFTAPITVLPIGLEPLVAPEVAKENAPTFIYVGRMAPSKRVHDIVEAFAIFGRGRLWLVGDGDAGYLATLRRRVSALGLDGKVEFLGRLSTDEKHERMARAHVLLMASVREGWGLSIAEANACGTPAIAYDVHGLRDAVRNDETGLVVEPNPRDMARAMQRLIGDPALMARFTAEGIRWTAGFAFDAVAMAMRKAVEEAVGDFTRRHPISTAP